MSRWLLASGLLWCLAAVPAHADDHEGPWAEMLARDLPGERAKLTEIGMDLAGGDLARFRTIYGEYAADLADLSARRAAIVRKATKAWPNPSEDVADDLAAESLAIDKDLAKVRKKAYKALKKDVGSANAARFLLVESQIAALIDLKAADALPLIRTLGKPSESEGLKKPSARGD